MARDTCLCLCILLGCLGLICAQECLSVNDVLPQVPSDLQELIKKEMDVLAFKGTFFLPTETAWQSRDLDPKFYTEDVIRTILRLSIIPGVRLATRPGGLSSGTLQLESKFKDTMKLFCLTGKRPNNEVDLEIKVKGTPSASTTFPLNGTTGNTYKAGDGEIQILKVYSDIGVQNVTEAILTLEDEEAKRVLDLVKDKDGKVLNISDIASWKPANVVKVVQCKEVDVFFVDHLLLPCPLCGEKCTAALVDTVVRVMLPTISVFAVALACAGYFAICCGCTVCDGDGMCSGFWKCVCSSLVMIIVVTELLVVAAFASFAFYINAFMKKRKAVKDLKSWQPYFVWAFAGALVMALVAVTHVWSFVSKASRNRRNRRYTKMTQAQAPHYR